MITALGLPLLMVNGKFQSLGSMTVRDLETFIPFLVKCSINKAGAQLINGVPEWWSSSIQCKFPLQKPNDLSQTGYRRHLASIVCSCYWYHDAQYLLPFCAKIASSPESVFLQSNDDNTTSIFYVHNTRQVLKFNNENKNYDRKSEKEKPSRQSLLPALPKQTTIIPDIYLCENCDAEFSSHSEMQKHENECYEIVIDDSSDENIEKEEVSTVEKGRRHRNNRDHRRDILQCVKPCVDPSAEKNSFFDYMKLQPKNSDKSERLYEVRKNGAEPTWKHWVNADLCLYKNPTVEFSSLYGRKMLGFSAKRDLISKPLSTFLVNEYYCSTSVTSRINREPRDLDFRVTCRKPKKIVWSHQYTFSKQQRRSRYTTLKTGNVRALKLKRLNEHSRKLLKQCKGVQIVLNRLTVPS